MTVLNTIAAELADFGMAIETAEVTDCGGGDYLITGNLDTGEFFDAVVTNTGVIEVDGATFYFDNHGNPFWQKPAGYDEWVEMEVDAYIEEQRMNR